MDENSLLQAIKAAVREEIEPIKSDIQGINTRLESLDQGLNTRIDAMQADITDIKDRVTKIEVTQENKIVPNIQLLAEGHSGVIDRLDRLDELPEKVEDIQNNVNMVKSVFKEHAHK